MAQFDEPIDILIVHYYGMYEQNRKVLSEQDTPEFDDFEKSKERKRMDNFLDAIVILRTNTGRR